MVEVTERDIEGKDLNDIRNIIGIDYINRYSESLSSFEKEITKNSNKKYIPVNNNDIGLGIFNNAIIGFTDDGLAVYNYEDMISCAVVKFSCTYDKARECVNRKVQCLDYMGCKKPIIVYPR